MYGLDRTVEVQGEVRRAPLELPDAAAINARIEEISARTGQPREEIMRRAIRRVLGEPPASCRGMNPNCPHFATCSART